MLHLIGQVLLERRKEVGVLVWSTANIVAGVSNAEVVDEVPKAEIVGLLREPNAPLLLVSVGAPSAEDVNDEDPKANDVERKADELLCFTVRIDTKLLSLIVLIC